jgi:hypothetical protein
LNSETPGKANGEGMGIKTILFDMIRNQIGIEVPAWVCHAKKIIGNAHGSILG